MKKERKRYKVINSLTTVNGTLYAKEAVFFENVEWTYESVSLSLLLQAFLMFPAFWKNPVDM